MAEKMNKWKMRRAGLLNFWYYDYEVFDFSDGKLLLRGSNGSGKSVTMQSFLPVLLDGKKTPDRLDPFGSKARRMEDYLLGEKEVVDRDERTGYLFIEYEREDTGQYITTGIGLQAKRQKPLKSWGFAITDNRRIGEDFELFKMEKGEKIPLSRIELENRIGGGGEVVQTNREYMALVNKHVFGFETLEAYEDLIKLLIQLRSPKLSKDFRPTVIYEILEAALPPLTDEDLRHLSDTIEHMDETRQHIEQVDRHIDALGKINAVYSRYNEHRLRHHAWKWEEARQRVTDDEQELENNQQKKLGTEQTLQELIDEKEQADRRTEVLTNQEESLRSHDVWRLEREKNETKDELDKNQRQLQSKEERLTEKKRDERKLQADLDQKEADEQEQEKDIEDALMNLGNDAAEASFFHHEFNARDFDRLGSEAFDTWKKQTTQHVTTLRELEDRLEKLERLKEKRAEKEREYSEIERVRDEKTADEKEWQRTFDEDKQKKLEGIFTWLKDVPWNVGDEVVQETSRRIYSLYEPVTYRDISVPFQAEHEAYTSNLQAEKLQEEHLESLVEKELIETKDELASWKMKRAPVPERPDATSRARETFARGSILPFYEAVEFRGDVDRETRNRIEAALLETGLLDALITEDKTDISHDRIIIPQPKTMAHTLEEYLQADVPDQTVSEKAVYDVLASIEVGEGASSVQTDGSYRLDILKGHAVPQGEAKFIGRSARERYRKEKIEELQEQIQFLEGQVSEHRKRADELIRKMKESSESMERFPNDEDLRVIYQNMTDVRRDIARLLQNMKEKDAERKELSREFRSMNQQLEEDTREFKLERSRESYKEALQVMHRYREELSELELIHQKYIHIRKEQDSLRVRIKERQEETDEVQGEINILEDQIQKRKWTLDAIEEQLRQQGAEEIRRNIERVQVEQREVKEKLGRLQNKIPVEQVNLDQFERRVKNLTRVLQFHTFIREQWRRLFVWEREFGFVEVDDSLEDEELAAELSSGYEEHKRESQLLEQVTKKFHEVNQDLVEYQLQQYPNHLASESFQQEMTNEESLLYKEWENAAWRNFVELNYDGRQVSPMIAEEKQREIREHQSQMLDEQDRELYEEILFKSVGNKLKSRIRRAKQWTEKMNSLMESRNSSSGLKFSIRWKPRTADRDEELDTKELVELLNRKQEIMKEEDFDRMVSHFRSRIDQAKEQMYERGEGQTLLQVLKEVLDYRKWFSFVLSYSRPSEPKRELTNNAFYKFSGGEKAMAMYIPLFAAAYSRYQEASNTAPYIISLDEAFAGVDENNIREMFEIVEELGFDYIMNSQVLWGDYDTVRNLAVSELIRPLNAGFVAVMNYEWNGQVLENREKGADGDG
ncbi:TIGR02680 family protein [Salimicrobium flavidum]|uniref:TIGR02680 family protein n=1 Tax=Salimicrobium flavidum TaxID=570947 RepID=A0A1N7J6R3_9BACI|nr:TIGR02680 family protein [Salimicrobium flavidum]SIS44926.1 TIGR02680 family protein [Salimicrobium flavidum]